MTARRRFLLMGAGVALLLAVVLALLLRPQPEVVQVVPILPDYCRVTMGQNVSRGSLIPEDAIFCSPSGVPGPVGFDQVAGSYALRDMVRGEYVLPGDITTAEETQLVSWIRSSLP